MTELKPCPFCGGNAEFIENMEMWGTEPHKMYMVRCSNCYVKTQYRDNIDKATKVWNRRVNK